MNGRFIFVLTTGILFFALRADVADDQKCPCSKPPKSDILSIHRTTTEDIDKCPCAKPPHREIIARVCACMASKPKPHRLEDFADKCPCSKPKPHKEPLTDGAADFIQATEAFTQIVTGGIIAHNTGDLKQGLSAIFTGINSLVDLTSRSAHPEEIYNQLYRFMASLDQQEMALLLVASKTAARTT